MPERMANKALAVEKCGAKHFSKKIPLRLRESKKGVVFNGLPLILLLYMLNDSHCTSTILGRLSNELLLGAICLRYVKLFLSGNCIQSAMIGKTSLAFASL